MKFNTIDISTFDDFRLGNADSRAKGTGVTVIVCDKGAVGGVDVRGGGPATRETDLLRSENTVSEVHAVVLSGGSAFGLEAASGVMRELSERGVGFTFGKNTIPIVCGASLYDLEVGDQKAFPDIEMGREAVRKAFNGSFRSGNTGAGTGCTVGKSKGMSRAMKTGLGTFACGDGSLEVGAVVAVNALGDVYNGAGNIIAGLRTQDGSRIYGTIRSYKSMVHDAPYEPAIEDTIIIDTRDIAEAQSRVEHKARMTEIAEAIRQEFRRTSEIKKSDILEALEKAEREAEEAKAAEEAAETPEEPVADEVETFIEEELNDQPSAVEEAVIEETAAAEEEFIEEPAVSEEEIIAEAEEAADDLQSPEDLYAGYEEASAEAVTGTMSAAGSGSKHFRPEDRDADEDDAETEPEPAVIQEEVRAQEEPEEEFAPDPDDLGYDIPFNTTIGCLITNAKLTKPQANKLASILHDAYARAIKPVHSTLDGDTIFVLASGRYEVNFDAFAALATDVMQYAVIDAAGSAKAAYGLPAAADLQDRR